MSAAEARAAMERFQARKVEFDRRSEDRGATDADIDEAWDRIQESHRELNQLRDEAVRVLVALNLHPDEVRRLCAKALSEAGAVWG